MILGYKEYFPWGEPSRFYEKIIKGNYPNSICCNSNLDPKIHTIREDINNRWKPGTIIHHAHGVRTKNYDCFDEGVCKSVQSIKIEEMIMISSDPCCVFKEFSAKLEETFEKIFKITIDDTVLTTEQMHHLAKNDGFDSTKYFFRWFNKPFSGKIIHWTDYKYY